MSREYGLADEGLETLPGKPGSGATGLQDGQLEWDPEVDASGIGVTAKGGVVTLTGFIDTYAGKLAAERATKRVKGVRGVANGIAQDCYALWDQSTQKWSWE